MENAAAIAMNFAMAAALFCSTMGTGRGGPFFVFWGNDGVRGVAGFAWCVWRFVIFVTYYRVF